METAAIFALVAVCGFFAIRRMAKNLGLLGKGGKPDCGCGSCAAKKKRGTA